MLKFWKIYCLLQFSLNVIINVAGAAAINAFLSRYPRRLEQSNSAYLPPYTAANIDDNVQKFHNNLTPASETFQAAPQITNQRINQTQRTKLFTSYVPPPSGFSTSNSESNSFQYSPPQPAHKINLPSLIPQSVLNQFPAKTINTNTYTPQQVYNAQTKQSSATTSTALVMLDSSKPSNFLTLNQNRTIEAARILASTLLEATGEKPLDQLNGLQVVDSSSLPDPAKALNSTDIVIVKSQKNAYLLPMEVTNDGTSAVDLDLLYGMRDQLNKAYTVNQFIFIIKPEKINFLNKLV